MKKNILDLTKSELEEIVKPKFRAKQIYNWIYQKDAHTFHEMSNLPKDMREELENNYTLEPLKIVKKERSSDGSVKYLYACYDGATVETVKRCYYQ